MKYPAGTAKARRPDRESSGNYELARLRRTLRYRDCRAQRWSFGKDGIENLLPCDCFSKRTTGGTEMPCSVPVIGQPLQCLADRLRICFDNVAILAVAHQLGGTTRVDGRDDGLAGHHRLDGDQAVIFAVGDEWHRQCVAIQLHEIVVADKAQPPDPSIALRELAQALLVGARAGDPQLGRSPYPLHGLDQQRHALRAIEPARREEIVEALAGDDGKIRRVMGDSDVDGIREISVPCSNRARYCRITRDRAGGQANIIQPMDDLPDERTGKAEPIVFDIERRAQLAQSIEQFGQHATLALMTLQ